MADVAKGGGAFAKVVQKTLVRTRTKVLQRVGKADKTTDDVFKDNVAAFQKQQATALRLQKEMKHYIACVKAMSNAARNLYAVLKDTYEEEWYDPHTVHSTLNSLDLMNTNYEAELSERVYTDLTDYVEQFPLYKEKMNKRRRKLLDYDNAKHAYDALYSAKKPDHNKISKAHESLEDAKAMFEEINNELHRELPRFQDYRVEFIATNLIKLFTAEGTLHNNTGKLDDQLVNVLQTLATTHAEEQDRLRDSPSTAPANRSHRIEEDPDALDLSSLSAGPQTPMKTNGHNGDMRTPNSHPSQTKSHQQQKIGSASSETEIRKAAPARPPSIPMSPGSKATTPTSHEEASAANNPFITEEDTKQLEHETPQPENTTPTHSNNEPDSEIVDKPAEHLAVTEQSPHETSGNPFEDDEGEEAVEDNSKDSASGGHSEPLAIEPVVRVIEQPQINETAETARESAARDSESKPSTSSTSSCAVLYQVMATHPYTAEDEDELSFDAGEIVNVIEFEDEEEQDDGWLMGINTKSKHKGVFPANFTQKIVRKS